MGMDAGISDETIMQKLGIDKETLELFKKARERAFAEVKKLDEPRTGKIKVLGISGSARDQFDMAQESSNSEELLKKCLKYCEDSGAQTELIALRKVSVKYCKACYSTANTQCHFYCSCYPKGTPLADDMTNILYDKILAADAIIFATPVNNFKISSLMAMFLDRCISLDGSLTPADPRRAKNKELNILHMRFIELTADPDVPGSGMIRRFAGKTAGIIATGHEEGAALAISGLYMTLSHYGMLFPPFSNMYAMATMCDSTYNDKKIVLSECYDLDAKMLAKNIVQGAELAREKKMSDWAHDNSKN